MTELIFSFDTEDFTSNEAANAIYREAEILREEGVKGCFCLVGMLAEQLVNWGRRDVIEALSHHEIANHTYGHSVHPLLNEYTDIDDAAEAIKRVIETEEKSLAAIKRATGRNDIYAAVPPGNQKSYAGMYAFYKMGLPIFADTFSDTANGDGAFYCNVYNLSYTKALETFLFNELSDEDMTKILDEFSTKNRVIAYHHPNMAEFPVFWDKLNYYKENLSEYGKWILPEKRPLEDIERFYENFRRFVRLAKADKRFKITGYEEIAEKIRAEKARVVTAADAAWILEKLTENFANIKTPVSLSLSDCMLAAKDFLLGKKEHVCGEVFGFLNTPYAVSETVKVTKDELIASAGSIRDGEFLPSEITVGEKKIGPADWLFASLEAVLGKDTVEISPKPQLPSLDVIPATKNARFRGTWMHSDEFEDKYLSERLRLQAYTLRFLSK